MLTALWEYEEVAVCICHKSLSCWRVNRPCSSLKKENNQEVTIQPLYLEIVWYFRDESEHKKN